MNIHFVALRKRNGYFCRILSAANSVGYRIGTGDRVFIYTNLCLDSADIASLRDALGCELYLQPLSADESAALLALPDVVTNNAHAYPDDANMLIDNDGVRKRGRVTIIPSYSSKFGG